ncbi:MAG: type transport system permease protein [Thermoanaerobaculia bacterium]|nr:type transport system permease protein [Thermoanaerobaculia bacterium]
MLIDIVRFEWRYHTRQISFAAATLLFFGFGFALTAAGFGPANVNVNSPYDIAQTLGTISLAGVFAMAVFCANAVVRDREYQLEEIVFSTSVGKFHCLFGRFAGSFLAAFTAFSASALGMMIAALIPFQDHARIGPFSVAPYLWALLVIVLPGMLVAGVTLFGIATLTRSMIASVVGAVAIYVFYFVAAAFTNSPLMAGSNPGAANASAAALLDPFGLSAFFDQTRYWTPITRNTRLISLTGTFLLNRVLWLAFAAITWTFVYRRFSFRLLTEPKRQAADTIGDSAPSSPYEPVAVSLTPRTQWRSFMAATTLEVRTVLGSIPFILLTLLWTGLAFAEIVADVAGGEYGAAFYPSTGFILGTLRQPFSLVASIIIIYYGAEIVWRERAAGIAEMLNATPAANAVFVFSKWIALSAMTIVLMAGGVIAGVLVQWTRDYHQFEPGVALSFSWVMCAPVIVFAMAAIVIQTLIPNKYAGMLVVLIIAVMLQGGSLTGLEHPLLRFGATPPVQYSAMNGFGHFAAPFNWFIAFWATVGALLLFVAAASWRRVRGDRVLRNSAHSDRRLAAVLVAAVLLTGGFIFYNTNVLNHYESSASALDWRADYETTYEPVASLRQPRIAAIRANVALYPQERRYQIDGRYDLVNNTTEPLGKVLVSVRRGLRVEAMLLAQARLVASDIRFGMYAFQLDMPLTPGQRLTLQFSIVCDNNGFKATGPDNSIVANGSFIIAQRDLPSVGYRKSYEIRNPSQRKNHGLPLKPEEDAAADVDLDGEWIDLDVTLSTVPSQIALSPGHLDKEWTANGRRFFHYRSERPIHNAVVFSSARYETASTTAGPVKIHLFYDPAHRVNASRILKAASDSLQQFEETFGPYPNRELNIAEAPSYWSFGGLAMPGLIFLSESRAFSIDARDPSRLDLITRRTAHEVAHQWWGHDVAPADAPGATAIVESLTKYSELLALEKTSGRAAVRRSLSYELDRYLAGRTDDKQPEVPLARVTNQDYLFYGKGAIVMRALDDLIGRPALTRALRSFVAEQAGPGHSATFDDLMRNVLSVAPAADQPLINEWMRDVVLYDLQVTSATSRRLPDGRFEVTMTIAAHKSRVNPNGLETALPLAESIAIGVFESDPDNAGDDATLHLGHHLLHEGANSITVLVSRQPAFAAIDPYLTRLDRNRSDNVRKVAQQ